MWENYWKCVESMVQERCPQRRVSRYRFFEEVWRLLDEGVPLVILEAPTGCGKTEAVSTPFLHQFSEGSPSWSSLIFSLPTRSLAYSMRERLSTSLKALGARWTTVTIDHGELYFRKPYLEGDVAVTTYDTLLYTFYGLRSLGHHLLLPVGKVASSLIVMDEAQLLQDTFWYSMALLPAHVHTLLALGAQMVVMTATMPPPLKKELQNGCKMSRGGRVECVKAEDKPSRGKIEVELRRGALPTEESPLRDLLDGVLKDPGLPILIVLNKVTKAVEVYRALRLLQRKGVLPEEVNLLLLHSRLRRGAREKVEKQLEREGRSGSSLILVSTQIVEAGLDYDFQTLITELSPVDSLIQRIGRIARRRGMRGRAIVYLDLEASENVYPKQVMKRTLNTVEEHMTEISDAASNVDVSSELVGEVYTEDIVRELQREVEQDIRSVRQVIWEFPKILILRMRPRIMEENLLRLGFEIKCLLIDEEDVNKILSGKDVEIEIEDYHKNIVSLSIQESLEKWIPIPKALIHKVDGKEYVIRLEIEDKRSEKISIKGEGRNPRDAYRMRDGELLFLLNRTYYEEFDGEELGVVKPWS